MVGFAKFNEKSVLVIGQEKGDSLESRIERNFGMMRPEGYRKTIRLMKLANKFNIPIIYFIDTTGAYPGVGAEERGQAEAIAKSIECCMSLNVPTLAIVIGDGGSGGAIALASSNKVIMLENAIYSVISPEVCATILWRDPKRTLEAAKAMKLSANELLDLGVIDEIVSEPLGGAHRDRDLILENVKGLRSHDKGKTLEIILKVLREDLGYFVPDPQVLNSKDFGLPQNRQRIFIVGFLKSNDFTFPEPLDLKTKVSQILNSGRPPKKYIISQRLWDSHKARKSKNKIKAINPAMYPRA